MASDKSKPIRYFLTRDSDGYALWTKCKPRWSSLYGGYTNYKLKYPDYEYKLRPRHLPEIAMNTCVELQFVVKQEAKKDGE
jgi:hypothetical protein